METPERKKVSVYTDLKDITKACFGQLKETTESITHAFHSVKNYNISEFHPLETDGMPLVITTDTSTQPVTDLDILRPQTYNWIFKKGFEEFVVALTESLIVAYRYARYSNLANQSNHTPIVNDIVLDDMLEAIDNAALLNYLPNLINEIEKIFVIELPLKMEIISINNVRNCLVHRNGRVSKVDLKKTSDSHLTLRYLENVVIGTVNGKEFELKWEHKVNEIKLDKYPKYIPTPRIKQFALNEKIIIDANVFNDVSFTCVRFTQELMRSLPKP